jgi:hypothetical protein
MKKIFIGLIVLITSLVLAVPAQATLTFVDTIAYTGQSPDSGTCGQPHWAHDAFTRNYSVSGSGTDWVVTETFKNGTFSTIAGVSPGACDSAAPPSGNGGLVNEGVQGKYSGFLKFPVTGTLDTNGACVRDPGDGMCHTSGWLDGFFPTGHVDGVPTASNTAFKFTYKAKNQGLITTKWINADATNGGNTGDIRNV